MADDTTSPADEGPHEPGPLPAGRFASWLRDTLRVQRGDGDAEVPCAGCTACCRAAYFIHIEPDETRTLARIPKALRFPAPGLPDGHVVLGRDEKGHCPMLVDDTCSIYEDRPRTCRRYDCRVFPATGLAPAADTGGDIARRVERWEFSHPTARDRAQHAAVQDAAAFVRERAGCFPAGALPGNPTQLAMFAIRAFAVFAKRRENRNAPTDRELACAVLDANESEA